MAKKSRGKKKSRSERKRQRERRAGKESASIPKEHEKVVENYLSCISYAKKLIAYKGPPLDDESDPLPRTGRRLLNLLNQASIIELPLSLFQRLHKAADYYVMHELLGSDWDSVLDYGNKADHLSREDTERAHRQNLEDIMEAGRYMEYPEKKLPFEVCFISYGAGVPMTEQQLWPRGFTTKEGQFIGGEILGHIVTSRGTVAECVAYQDSYGEWKMTVFWHRDHVGWTDAHRELMKQGRASELPVSWNYCYSMMPWMIPEVVRAIDDHKTVVMEKPTSFREKNRIEKMLKKTGWSRVPKPFYIVYMDDQYIAKRVKRTCANIRRSAQRYRSKIRSHNRVLVQRGKLPLKPKYEKALLKRKYKIFTDKPLDFETYQDVKVRGLVPKQVGEWMAVRKFRVKEGIRGPMDAPFIESVRRSRKLDKGDSKIQPSEAEAKKAATP